MAAVGLMLMPILTACAKTSASSGAPSGAALYASRLTLDDVTPVLPDAKNWWVAAPTFDVRPLNSATRDDADRGGVTIRFSHVGTAEILSLNYDVLSSTTVATAVMNANRVLSGTGVTGPKAGDDVLYYNRKLGAGPTVYNNVAFVRVGQTLISIAWSHVDGYASTSSVGKIAAKAVSRLRNGLGAKATPPPLKPVDATLLAPADPYLTLLGATVLPIEVLGPMIGQTAPAALADEIRANGVTDFVFGDYTLNNDTRMEVQTAGLVFSKFPTGGEQFVTAYFGAKNLSPAGEAGYYDTPTGQYLYGFANGSRAILMVCKSSFEGEDAARACEAPMTLVVGAWHSVMGAG